MRTIAFTLIACGGLFSAYWFLLRPILKMRAEFKDVFDALDRREASLWLKIRMSVKGLKTRLLNMALVITGLALAGISMVEGGDLSWLPTVTLPVVGIAVTPSTYGPVLLSGIGALNVYLRNISTTEVGEPLPPEIAAEVKTVNLPESVSTPTPAPLIDPVVASAVEEVKADKALAEQLVP